MATKEEIVKRVNDMYQNNEYAVFVDYKGLNAEDTVSFRRELRMKCDARFLVVKNTLNKLGAKGSEYENNVSCCGQCGVVFCKDILNVAKVINEFCLKNKKLKLIGTYNKSEVISEEKLKEFALLPSIEVLRAKFVYILNSVCASFVRVLAEKIKKEEN